MDPSFLIVKLEEPGGDLEDSLPLSFPDPPPSTLLPSKASRQKSRREPKPVVTPCLLCGQRRRSTFRIHSPAHKETWTEGTSRAICQILDIDYAEYEGIFQDGILCQSCFLLSSDIQFATKMLESVQGRLKAMESTLTQLIINHYGSVKMVQNSTPQGQASSLFVLVAKKLKQKYTMENPEEILPTRRKRSSINQRISSEIEGDQGSDYDDGGGCQGQLDSDPDPDFIVDDKAESDSEAENQLQQPETDDEDDFRPKRKKKRSNVIPKLPCPRSDCPKLFTTKLNVKVHVHSVHEGSSSPYYCEFPECPAKFRSHEDLLIHTTTHKNAEGKFPCPIPNCPNLYPRISWLCDHIKSTRGGHGAQGQEEEPNCPLCGKSFKNEDTVGLKRHQALHDVATTPFTCVIAPCSEKCVTLEGIKSHVQSEHEEFRLPPEPPKEKRIWKTKKPAIPKLPCTEPNCSLLFTTNLKVKVHVRSFHGGDQEPYHCEYPYCHTKFTSYDLLLPHSNGHKNLQGEFPCPLEGCSRTFSRISWLCDHIHARHAGVERAQCQVCGKRFQKTTKEEREEELRCHEILHEMRPPFTCVMSPCAQSFGNRGDLKRHVEVEHEDVGVFCALCPKERRRSFPNQGAVDRHVMCCHGDVGKRQCPVEGCKVVLKNKKNLRQHLRLHDATERMTHMCEECGATYNKKSSLTRHMLASHRNERPHKCIYCDRRFSYASNLRNHEEVHLDQNQRNHLCSGCGKSFRLKQSLWQHVTFYCPLRVDKGRKPSECRKRMKNAPRQRSEGPNSKGGGASVIVKAPEPGADQSESSASSEHWGPPVPFQIIPAPVPGPSGSVQPSPLQYIQVPTFLNQNFHHP